MSKNLEPSRHFDIRPSRLLRLAVMGIHGLALLACWLNSLPAAYQAVLSVLIVLSAWRHPAFAGAGPLGLRHTPEQGWLLLRGDRYMPVKLKSSTVISGFLVVLHWAGEEKSSGSIVIPYDAMSADDYRRLMVCLKISSYA